MGDFFEEVALDDVADFVFLKVAGEADAAFEAVADFFDFVLEAAEGGDTAVVNGLFVAEDAGAGGAGDAAIGDVATGDAAFGEVEELADFGVADDSFAEFGFEEAGHCLFDLVNELVDDAEEFDLDAFALGGGGGVVFDSDAKADDDGVGGASEEDVGLGDGADGGVNDVELDFFRMDFFEGGKDGFEGTLDVGFEDEVENFLLVRGGSSEEVFESSALGCGEFTEADFLEALFTDGTGFFF